jgi:hypothetical protein
VSEGRAVVYRIVLSSLLVSSCVGEGETMERRGRGEERRGEMYGLRRGIAGW